MVSLNDAIDVSNLIVKNMQPVSIVIFGSVGRNDSGKDLDLLIITEDTSKTIREINLQVNKYLKPFYKRFGIDPFVIPLSVLREYHRKGSPFLRLILKEGRSLYMKDAVKEWFKQAKDELDMALYLFKGGYYKGTCYHSQQSIEKSIKASLLSKGWVLERIHNLERLISIAEDYGITLNILEEDAIFIDSIYRGRYPAEAGLLPLGEPSDTDSKRSLSIAENTYSSIKAFLQG
ncbi:MAG: HEPN domain-containing protein [Candidatus Kuenenia sp.]|nr:HEPN domain-containing protein [Candidatus Kuenenia hertensis]